MRARGGGGSLGAGTGGGGREEAGGPVGDHALENEEDLGQGEQNPGVHALAPGRLCGQVLGVQAHVGGDAGGGLGQGGWVWVHASFLTNSGGRVKEKNLWRCIFSEGWVLAVPGPVSCGARRGVWWVAATGVADGRG